MLESARRPRMMYSFEEIRKHYFYGVVIEEELGRIENEK